VNINVIDTLPDQKSTLKPYKGLTTNVHNSSAVKNPKAVLEQTSNNDSNLLCFIQTPSGESTLIMQIPL
jgi:hypothetical protein